MLDNGLDQAHRWSVDHAEHLYGAIKQSASHQTPLNFIDAFHGVRRIQRSAPKAKPACAGFSITPLGVPDLLLFLLFLLFIYSEAETGPTQIKNN